MRAVDRFRVVGGAHLHGEVRVTGAKNSVLKLMAAALLAPGQTTLHRVPDILDVDIMAELLRRLGCTVEHDAPAGTVVVDVPEKLDHRADYDLVRRMRASINVLGPLVVRSGAAEVALPGGDAIGSRPLDFHVAGLARMGALVDSEHGFIVARAPRRPGRGADLSGLPQRRRHREPPHGGDAGRGTTIIDNAAREPEIVDLCRMLDRWARSSTGSGRPPSRSRASTG